MAGAYHYRRLVGLVAVAAVVSAAGVAARADEFHGLNPGAPVWNGGILTSQTAAAIASTGCRSLRINFRLDGHSSWDSTILGQYDQVVQNVRNQNITILGLISNESVAAWQAQWNDDPDGDGINSYVWDYSNVALLLIDRYKQQIKTWELLNEPNAWTNTGWTDPKLAGGTYILPRVYANVLAETYKTLNYNSGRRILSQNNIKLCSAGLYAHDRPGSGTSANSYMQEVYDQAGVWNGLQQLTGRRYPWDLFGYHFYLDNWGYVSTAKVDSYLSAVRALQAGNGDHTPMLITEWGWNTYQCNETQQSANMQATSNLMESKAYIWGTYWYQWQDESTIDKWGIRRADGSQKPSYAEFVAQNAASYPVPVADFAASATAGVSPLIVQFTDSSVGRVSAWSWSFGDGITSTAFAPSHAYVVPGTYTVSLTVTGPGGSDVETKTGYITVTAPPPGANLIANGDFTSMAGWTKWTEKDRTGDFVPDNAGGALHVDGTDYNGGVWQQFATGGAGSEIVISGRWWTGPLVANYQWAEVQIINGPRTPVDGVDELSQPENIMIYKNDTWVTPGGWNGVMANTAPVSNIGRFTAAGDVATILLKSGNIGGIFCGIVYDDLLVRSTNEAPTARISAGPASSGDAPLLVQFDAGGSSDPEQDPLSFTWSLGDGTTSSGTVIHQIYSQPGSYTVTLTASDGKGGVGQATVAVQVGGEACADLIVETRDGGKNLSWYGEQGVWGNHATVSTAPGVTTGIGCRFGSTWRTVAGEKSAVFAPVLPTAGPYRVFATWPASSFARQPILHRVSSADGVSDVQVDQTQNADRWVELGTFNFAAGSGGSVTVSNALTDLSGSMYVNAMRFVASPPARSPADFDRDGDVDLADFGKLQACLGPAFAAPPAGCTDLDLDGDDDVDADDLSQWRPCLSGPDQPADPQCGR